MADSLSADGPARRRTCRRKLRERACYEVTTNAYAKGIVLTIANDTIGTGPRQQLLTGDAPSNRLAEEAFAGWARAVNLAGKLRTMRVAKATDGETFAVLTGNPEIDSTVKLDVRFVEVDRVASPVVNRPVNWKLIKGYRTRASSPWRRRRVACEPDGWIGRGATRTAQSRSCDT